MKKAIARACVFCVLAALLLGGVISGGAEEEFYLCEPFDFSAVYYPETETVVCRGRYTGWMQTNRTYQIMMADANGGMVTLQNPKGVELNPVNGMFEYSFALSKSVYDGKAKPFSVTLSCYTQGNVIRPVKASIVLPLLGDANHDGTVDNIDAAKILMYDADNLAFIDSDAADVNGDGAADNLDAATILRYDAGIISGF